jgi:hypothetical protein
MPRNGVVSGRTQERRRHGRSSGEVPEMGLRFLDVGGDLAVLVTSAGKPYAFVSLAVVDGCIAGAWVANNPDKLIGLQC